MDAYDECYDDFDDDIDYIEPPLYAAGKLASMALEQLEAEMIRQCDTQGRLGDAEYIDETAVARAESRCRLIEAEIKRRAG